MTSGFVANSIPFCECTGKIYEHSSPILRDMSNLQESMFLGIYMGYRLMGVAVHCHYSNKLCMMSHHTALYCIQVFHVVYQVGYIGMVN